MVVKRQKRIWWADKSSCFGAVCRLANFLVFRDWGGFISGLRWLSIGFVSVLPMEKDFGRVFFHLERIVGIWLGR